MKKTCKRCGKSWDARVKRPVKCIYCQRRDWSEKNERFGNINQGRRHIKASY